MKRKSTAFVAYDRRSGIPWVVGLDENEVYDYALENNLVVLEVTRLGEM